MVRWFVRRAARGRDNPMRLARRDVRFRFGAAPIQK